LKKVLVFRSHLLPRSETFIRDQVVACTSWKAVLVGFVRAPDGLPIDDLNLRLLDGSRPALLGKIHRALLADFAATRRSFVATCRTEAPDLLHVHFGTDAVMFWPTLRQLTPPLLVTLHGQDITIHREAWERNRLRFSKRLYPRRLSAMAENPRVHFVAVSEDIRQAAIQYGIAAERITVRHIGIDLSRFRFSGSAIADRLPRIVFVGRLVEKKGVEFLIRAFARVSQQVAGAQLAILGGGPLAGSLRALAAELGAKVEFLGSVDRAEVSRQLSIARVLCLPSVTAANGDAEGMGMVILEAQACGLPVVTSARGGKTEAIVDGRTGFAFPERDVDLLTEHLSRLLLDDDLATAMGAAAIPHVAAHFDIRDCTRKLEQFYDRLSA
jgi:glycosyltransferase involved in cell wall biosynthesis